MWCICVLHQYFIVGGKMKEGTLAVLDHDLYGRFGDHLALLVERAPVRKGKQWVVLIKGKVHPFYVDEEDIYPVQPKERA